MCPNQVCCQLYNHHRSRRKVSLNYCYHQNISLCRDLWGSCWWLRWQVETVGGRYRSRIKWVTTSHSQSSQYLLSWGGLACPVWVASPLNTVQSQYISTCTLYTPVIQTNNTHQAANTFRDKMSIHWTLIAGFLYAEIGVILLLLVPFISTRWKRSQIERKCWLALCCSTWNKVFKSRFLKGLESQLIYYFYVLVSFIN